MANIAFFTVGVLQAPYDDPQITPLGELLDPVWAAAESSPGFVVVSKPEVVDADGRVWGPIIMPTRFQEKAAEMRLLATLSIWENPESVFAFTFNGLHGQTFRRRKEWFVPKDWPGYVAWWIKEDEMPTWAEASKRYEQYCELGSTAEAFDFKHPFDENGREVKLGKESVKMIASNF